MPEITITLPTLYPAQVTAFRLTQKHRFVAIRCGRRWGKTDFGKTIACDGAVKGEPIGWFAPDYKIQTEAYNEIESVLMPVKKASSKIEGVIRTTTGGRIDFWTLENERAGRSRKYKKVIIDEAAFTKPNMMEIWEKSIKPTLLDYVGRAVILSNANGSNRENFFYLICTDPKYGFVEYHGPTHQNPYLPREELARLEADNHPLVFKQEYLAEFIDWSGSMFFKLDDVLDESGQPFDYPKVCECVFATIDTGAKTGKENDGTGVTLWARTGRYHARPLLALDYFLTQIEGDMLINWLPSVFQRLEHLAKECNAIRGSIGAFIEDRNSGMILIQQATRANMPAVAIDSKLTSVGKTERAINASGYVTNHQVGLTKFAFEKTLTYHERTRNHWITQFIDFRVNDEDPRAEDDLLDTICYGIAIALGDESGF